MAAPTATSFPAQPDLLVTVKVAIEGSNRKFKLPLHELGPAVFVDKIRALLNIPADQQVFFERFSDSANSFVVLDNASPSAYKQLYRAAKAKLKLRIRATPIHDEVPHSANAATDASKPTSFTAPPENASSTLYAASSYLASVPGSTSASTFRPQPQSTPASDSKPSPASIPMACRRATKLHPARQQLYDRLAHIAREREAAGVSRCHDAPVQAPKSNQWQVFCNACDKPMADAHFHCSICDGGDYDLCESCVQSGKLCRDDQHWLIKRFVCGNTVVNSTTERIAPKPRTQPLEDKEMPGAFTLEQAFERKLELEFSEPKRTCNCCINTMNQSRMVTCLDCEDFDLCLDCNLENIHGHHPGHKFEPVRSATVATTPGLSTLKMCNPGRNHRHWAVCDGCDAFIYGVRHKCLDCPDWDFCGTCIDSAKDTHPGHVFVPIYASLGTAARTPSLLHTGIYCDGPLCDSKVNKEYISGVRYKCAICHDTDFCATCEAHPSNAHNPTHPLIKFKTPVRNVSVTTLGENKRGEPLSAMGDKRASARVARTEARNTRFAHLRESLASALPVVPPQPVENLSLPDETVSVPATSTESASAAQVEEAVENKPVVVATSQTNTTQAAETHKVPYSKLDAHFIRDTIQDGSFLPANTVIIQTWTIRNPGPYDWPVGCSVRHVGGDNMLNIDHTHPSSTTDLAEARESNATTHVVHVGESFPFSVTMRAPERDGRYISYWRTKAPDGTPFGHKLWCDIEVMKADAFDLPIKREAESEEDRMVFPKLERESPMSSLHEDAEPAGVAICQSLAPTEAVEDLGDAETETAVSQEDTFEDVHSDFESDEEDDDGFMTDEEYDILDASDEDIAKEGRPNA